MKKLSLVLIALTSAGTGFAQSSATLSGIVDVGLTRGESQINSKTSVTSGNNNTSRVIFRGTENMEGGLVASFWLEAGINADNGTGLAINTNNQSTGLGVAPAGTQGVVFNRRSTVSLAGKNGELRLGQDFTPHYWNLTLFDPFGSVGVGATQLNPSSVGGLTRVRASNSIGYFLPGNLGGFYGQAMYFMGENPTGVSNSKDGTGSSSRLGYRFRTYDMAVAYAKTSFIAGNISTTNAALSYTVNDLKLAAVWNVDRVDSLVRLSSTGYMLGATQKLGDGQIKASIAAVTTDSKGSPRTNKQALGYVHHLSKRTALYTAFAKLRNSGGASIALGGATAAANKDSTGFDIGLRHAV